MYMYYDSLIYIYTILYTILGTNPETESPIKPSLHNS